MSTGSAENKGSGEGLPDLGLEYGIIPSRALVRSSRRIIKHFDKMRNPPFMQKVNQQTGLGLTGNEPFEAGKLYIYEATEGQGIHRWLPVSAMYALARGVICYHALRCELEISKAAFFGWGSELNFDQAPEQDDYDAWRDYAARITELAA